MMHKAQRVLVTGATGYVGGQLVRRLCDEGRDRVRLLVRHPQKLGTLHRLPAEVIIGDLANAGHVASAAEGMEVIYHLGAAKEGPWEEHVRGTVEGTANIVQAALQRPHTKLVHISSIAVYGIPHRPQQVFSENAPYADREVTRYARAKIAAERIVREAIAQQGLAATILRPGIVHGPGSPVHLSKIGYHIGNTFFVVGRGDVTLPLIDVDHLVEAILLAGRSARSIGRIYHVVDDDCPTQTGYIRRLNATGPVRYAHVLVPRAVAAAIGWIARRISRCHPTVAGIGTTLSPLHVRSCTTDLVFDTSRIKDELGWEPDSRIEKQTRQTCAAMVEGMVCRNSTP